MAAVGSLVDTTLDLQNEIYFSHFILFVSVWSPYGLKLEAGEERAL